MKWIQKWWVAAGLALLAVVVLTYSNGLTGPFMIDDFVIIDERARNLDRLWEQFWPNRNKAMGVWGRASEGYYRPFAVVLPMIGYALFGNWTPGYHVMNLFLFCLGALILARLLETVFRDRILALLTVVWLVIHPLNAIVVNYITASVFAAQVLFMALGLGCVWKSANQPSMDRKFFGWQMLAGIFYALAVMCHETAMAFPFYAAGLLLAGGRFPLKQVLRGSGLFFVMLAFYFLWRVVVISLSAVILVGFSSVGMNFWQILASMGELVFWYLWRFFRTDGIVLMWTTRVTSGPMAAIWLAGAIALVGTWISAWRFCRTRNHRAAGLGLLWLATGFIPFVFGTAFQPYFGLTIEPHWFVFSSSGMFLFLAALTRGAWMKADVSPEWRKPSRLLIVGMVTLMTGGWSLATRGYNHLWADERRYCEYWLRQDPDLTMIRGFLGRNYLQGGEVERAKEMYLSALTGLSADQLILNNLGIIAHRQGNMEEAEMYFEKYLALEPAAPAALVNLGVLAMEDQDLPRARAFFESALAINPLEIPGRINLAQILEKQNDHAGAARVYEEMTMIDPNLAMAWLKVGIHRLTNGDLPGARVALNRSLALEPDSWVTLSNLGVLELMDGDNREEARKLFERAIALDPSAALPRENLRRLLLMAPRQSPK